MALRRMRWFGFCAGLLLLVAAGCGRVDPGQDQSAGAPEVTGAQPSGTMGGGIRTGQWTEDEEAEESGVALSATRTPLSLATPYPTRTPSPVATEVESPQDADVSGTEVAVSDEVPAEAAAAAAVDALPTPAAVVAPEVTLARVDDVDPAPPLTVLVDSARVTDDGANVRVTGWIRNDGETTYEDVGIEATFYDGSPWHFGPFDAAIGCYALAPGELCSFSVEAYARTYTGYRLHPEGHPVKAWTPGSTALAVEDVTVVSQVAGYVYLTGIVRNDTGATVDVVRVSGALLNANAQVTSVGTTVVGGQLAPGAQITFDLRIPAGTYASYQVTAEAQLP